MKKKLLSAEEAHQKLNNSQNDPYYGNKLYLTQIEALGNLPLILLNPQDTLKKVQEINDQLLHFTFDAEKVSLASPLESRLTHYPLLFINNGQEYIVARKINSYEVYYKNKFIFSYVSSGKFFKISIGRTSNSYMRGEEITKLIKSYISCINFI